MPYLRSALLLIVSGLVCVADCHIGIRTYPIYEIPTADIPDLRDGSLEDWTEAVPGPTVVSSDVVGSFEALSPDDLSVRVYMAWHAQSGRIYTAVEMFDDYHADVQFDIDGFVLRATDMVIVKFDGDHSGGEMVHLREDGESQESALLRNFVGAQSYVTRVSNDPGLQQLVADQYARWWMLEAPFAEVHSTVEEEYGLSVTEMAFTPWDNLDQLAQESSAQTVLRSGEVVGLGVEFLDLDESGLTGEFPVYRQYTLAPWTDAFSASELSDAVLVPCERLDCSGADGTVVGPSSWARIKAAAGRDYLR